MFWVACPKCDGPFYCHTEDLWDTGIDLLCPFCGNTFDQESGVAAMKSVKQEPRRTEVARMNSEETALSARETRGGRGMIDAPLTIASLFVERTPRIGLEI